MTFDEAQFIGVPEQGPKQVAVEVRKQKAGARSDLAELVDVTVLFAALKELKQYNRFWANVVLLPQEASYSRL